MKTIIFAMLFGAFFFGTVDALVVKQVHYNPENGRIVAQVFNNSTQTVDGFNALFFVDGKEIGKSGADNQSVLPKSTVTVFFEYPFDGKEHEFTVKVTGDDEQAVSSQISTGTAAQTPNPDGTIVFVLLFVLGVGAIFLIGWLFLKKTILTTGEES